MHSAGTAGGVTHRAFQIARRRDLEHAQARMLFVFGAKATVKWAAATRFNSKPSRHFAWSEKLVAIEPARIAADEVFANTMYWTAFAEIDTPVAFYDFGGD